MTSPLLAHLLFDSINLVLPYTMLSVTLFSSSLDGWDVDLALMAGVCLGGFLISGRWFGKRNGKE